MTEFVKCGECMRDAPFSFCCKTVCGEREACQNCTSPARGTVCPNDERYFEEDKGEQCTGEVTPHGENSAS